MLQVHRHVVPVTPDVSIANGYVWRNIAMPPNLPEYSRGSRCTAADLFLVPLSNTATTFFSFRLVFYQHQFPRSFSLFFQTTWF